jgi:hypothetical protein
MLASPHVGSGHSNGCSTVVLPMSFTPCLAQRELVHLCNAIPGFCQSIGSSKASGKPVTGLKPMRRKGCEPTASLLPLLGAPPSHQSGCRPIVLHGNCFQQVGRTQSGKINSLWWESGGLGSQATCQMEAVAAWPGLNEEAGVAVHDNVGCPSFQYLKATGLVPVPTKWFSHYLAPAGQ